MIALLLACASPWTREAAVHPTLVRLDRGGDGTVDAEDWRAAVPTTPTFETVDRDENGRVDDAELLAALLGTSPRLEEDETEIAERQRVTVAHPTDTWLVLTVLRDDLIGTPGEAVAPSTQALQDLAPRPLAAPEVQAALRQLRSAYEAAGRSFPAALAPQ